MTSSWPGVSNIVANRIGQRARTCLLSAALLFLGASAPMAQTWESLGPTNIPGVINGLDLHLTSNKLFASSPDGGLWVTDANSATPRWSPISDKLDNIEVRAFAVAPTSPQGKKIYLANKTFSLYRTADGGQNWVKVPSVTASFGRVNKIVVSRIDSSTVFLATTTGLWISENDGDSWAGVLLGKDVLDIAIDRADPAVWYVGVRLEGVCKTTNGGQSWTKVLAWNPEVNTHDYVPKDFYPSQIIKLSLGRNLSNGVPETATARTVAVRFGNEVWISRTGQPDSFVKRTANVPDACGYYTRTESHVKGEWCNAIAVDPFNSDRVLVGAVNLYQVSVGDSTAVDTSHVDVQHIVFSETVRNLVFAAHDGGVDRSSNNTLAFSAVNDGLVTGQLARVGISGRSAVGNSDHNGIVGTASVSDGTWARQVVSRACGYGNAGMERNGVYKDPKRGNRFYWFDDLHLGVLKFPYPSGNDCKGGDPDHPNATQFSPFVPFKSHPGPEYAQGGIAVDTRTDSQLILVAADNFIRASCDGECQPPPNSTWSLMLTSGGDKEPTGVFGRWESPGPGMSAVFVPGIVSNMPKWEVTKQSMNDPFVSVAFSPHRSTAAYAMTNSGILYRASIPLPPPPPNTIRWTALQSWGIGPHDGVRHMAVHPGFDDIVYAITGNTLVRTNSAGTGWITTAQPIAASRYYAILLRPQAGSKVPATYVGTSNGVWASTNDGATWVNINGNLPNVKTTQLHYDNGFLYAVTFGRGLWRVPIASVGTSELDPAHSTANADEPFNLELTWTHPGPWRSLDTIDFRIGDDDGAALWVRFDEAANTFSEYDPHHRRYEHPAPPGSSKRFQTEAATMYLESSRVQGSGAEGHDVTLTYNVRFKRHAKGRTYRIEVAASDDLGNQQDFEQIGTISIGHSHR